MSTGHPTGRVAVITGSSSGIGEATARVQHQLGGADILSPTSA